MNIMVVTVDMYCVTGGLSTAEIEKLMEPLLSQMSAGGQMSVGPLTAAVQASGLFSK